MNISGLLSWIAELPAYAALLEELREGVLPAPLGLLRAARPALVAALAGDLQRPLLLVVANAEQAAAMAQSIRDWKPAAAGPVLRLPEPDNLFYELAPWTRETIVGRLQVLTAMFAQDFRGVVVASARALMQPTLPRRLFRTHVRDLAVGQLIDLEQTLRYLAGSGYEPVSVVEAPGQFSHRGGILDVFPPAASAVRIELFGNEIDSIRSFNPSTQRSEDRIERVRLTPGREALPRYGETALQRLPPASEWPRSSPELVEQVEAQRRNLATGMPFATLEFYLPYLYDQPAALLDYLPANGLVVLDNPAELRDAWAGLESEALDLRATAEATHAVPPAYPLPYVAWSEWNEGLTDCPSLVLSHGEALETSPWTGAFVPGPRFGGQLQDVLTHVQQAYLDERPIVVVSRQASRLAELWAKEGDYFPVFNNLETAPQGLVTLVQGALAEGWVLQEYAPPRHLLTDAEVFGWRRPQSRVRPRKRHVAPESFYADLTPGDYVVHIEYGVGIFRGLTTRSADDAPQEYLLIEYDNGDLLYVPLHQADRLNRYIGVDDQPPTLNRLGTSEWQTLKERAQRAAEEVAEEMLDLYAKREVVPGHPFSPDTPWQAELEASFPYVETPDQLRAIADVKADMERARPMDRLICGDVGYGKTEVALRAAFKAVMDGKQVALLVPTTVLAQQHFTTFRRRLAPFPVEVEMLSRFRSRAEQQRILQRLMTGQVDVLIGTHRLLQTDVLFKDLGLLIIDEEQRFGVTHKERLKQMRTEVDVLTLTATPIPRTLYLSLTGVRDISTIDTPPEERLPINTYVGEYDDQLVRRAILRELERDGQVFYVHNRVQTIEAARQRLERLVPEATFVVAHGQMHEHQLERQMVRFVEGEVDVLICTSIIESGLDIPNANTLIIERADRFGLAQLYQLRGRVGRGAQRAYAYLLTARHAHLNPDARARLETMRETTDLGAGYTIAMRDLEIRGTGEILGTRQSGHIAAVGFGLYTRLLARAVQSLKARRAGQPPPPEPLGNIIIDLPHPVYLPPEYVPDMRLRLNLYRRLAELATLEDIEAMETELNDRFGPLPPPACNLIYQLRLKALARQVGVGAILTDPDKFILRTGADEYPDRPALQQLLTGRASVGRREIWVARPSLGQEWREGLIDTLQLLAQNG